MQTLTLTFDAMGLQPQILQMIAKKGFENPTPIQVEAIPPGLDGRDIMARPKQVLARRRLSASPC